MKKHLLLLSGLVIGGMAVAQNTPVSQTVQKRVAVLEELTGINCQYCPDGHKIANNIAAANPGKVVLVNIHAGSFAPTSGQYNFTTAAGNALNTYFNPTGYPAGTVQRKPYGSETRLATSRSNWAGMVNTTINENSEVNVAIDASINAATRELTVTVELFYTSPFAAGTNHYLNVGITQDNIESTHVSGNTNPAQMLPNGKYNNLHMFRMFINNSGTWGDVIDASSTGVITKTYTMTLPANVGTIPLELGNLHVYAILHQGNNTAVTSRRVYTAAQTTPTYTNLSGPVANLNAINNEFNAECNTNASVTPVVKVKNTGSDISSVEFSYSVNGGAASTYTYNTAIPTFGTADVTLPAINFPVIATNSITVTITSVDAGSGTVGTTSTLTKTISSAAVIDAANGSEITINVNTDNYPSETTWELKNAGGTIIASGGPYIGASGGAAGGADALKKKSHSVIIPADGCYSFTLKDGYGDGLSYGTNPNGGVGYSIDYNGTPIYSRLQATWDFGSASVTNGVIKAEGGITAEPIPSVFTGCSPSNVNAGSTVTFGSNNANTGVTFAWVVTPNTGVTFEGGTSASSKNPQIKFAYGGNYEVALTTTNAAGNNNTTTQNCVKVVGGYMSIEDVDFAAGISVYPNPTAEVLNATLTVKSNTMVGFRVINAQGQTVMMENISMNAGTNMHSFDVGALAAGYYTVQFTAEGQVSTKPFVKQ